MRTIHKYPFGISDEFGILMPTGAQILCVQVQRGNPCIWALVDPDAPKCNFWFRLRGTGQPMHGSDIVSVEKYIGTFQLHDGSFVGHLFKK